MKGGEVDEAVNSGDKVEKQRICCVLDQGVGILPKSHWAWTIWTQPKVLFGQNYINSTYSLLKIIKAQFP